ncbi:divalent-cation tolerance protein CutA [Comamonas guangdongensis]|uniref:Divalent-cation tolerance protein CutA n=1 Tax=Comamonas guangdongensis TaxID=510515 RepID=A0ABV3ZQ25_9BURK
MTSKEPSPQANGHWATLCVVTTTVAHAAEAEDLARALVTAQVAACVQTERITSYYEWDGVLQATPEWRLVCKTLPDVLPRLTQLLREQHSYEVPQISVSTERCLADYAQWLKKQVHA